MLFGFLPYAVYKTAGNAEGIPRCCRCSFQKQSAGWLLIGILGIGLADFIRLSLFRTIPSPLLGQLEQLRLAVMALIEEAEKLVPQGNTYTFRRKRIIVGRHLLFTAQKIGDPLLISHTALLLTSNSPAESYNSGGVGRPYFGGALLTPHLDTPEPRTSTCSGAPFQCPADRTGPAALLLSKSAWYLLLYRTDSSGDFSACSVCPVPSCPIREKIGFPSQSKVHTSQGRPPRISSLAKQNSSGRGKG